MKQHLAAALAISLMAALAAVAVAQTYQIPAATFDAGVTPTNAGTKQKPKASKIRLRLSVPKEARLTSDQLTFHLPQHVRVSGKGFRYCPSTRLDTTKNPNKCPRRSKVGQGTATFAFGPNLTTINFNVGIFAGSRNELGIWLQGTNLPLAKALRGIVSKSGAPYNQKLTIDIPRELQQHLGAWFYLTGLNATFGASNGRRGSKRRNLITTVGCPADRLHRFEARLRFVANPNPPSPGEVVKTDTSACTR